VSEILFVSDKNARNFICTKSIEDLVIDDLHHLKRSSGCDGIHKHISVNTNCVLTLKDRVFILQEGEVVRKAFSLSLGLFSTQYFHKKLKKSKEISKL
jgi:hypothetical protein